MVAGNKLFKGKVHLFTRVRYYGNLYVACFLGDEEAVDFFLHHPKFRKSNHFYKFCCDMIVTQGWRFSSYDDNNVILKDKGMKKVVGILWREATGYPDVIKVLLQHPTICDILKTDDMIERELLQCLERCIVRNDIETAVLFLKNTKKSHPERLYKILYGILMAISIGYLEMVEALVEYEDTFQTNSDVSMKFLHIILKYAMMNKQYAIAASLCRRLFERGDHIAEQLEAGQIVKYTEIKKYTTTPNEEQDNDFFTLNRFTDEENDIVYSQMTEFYTKGGSLHWSFIGTYESGEMDELSDCEQEYIEKTRKQKLIHWTSISYAKFIRSTWQKDKDTLLEEFYQVTAEQKEKRKRYKFITEDYPYQKWHERVHVW